MRFGIYGINAGACTDPAVAARVAQAAEAAGFDSVWTAEHVVLPDPQAPPSPLPPDFPLLDPVVALAFLAGQTQRVRLATGIVILPQRNPVVLAKALASVDVLSGGRLVFGVGAGYLRPEFEAIGAPFAERGARTDEYLDAIVALWTQARPEFKGRYAAFAGIDARPRPVQKPHPPLVIGGLSPGALKRAVTRGNGWYGFALDFAATERCLAGLEEARRSHGRPAELGELEITITPAGALDRDAVRRWADLGVHRLVPFRPARDGDKMVAEVERLAELVGA